ncbi:MAG: N-formylglutamate amidohydrolase [Gammaproteobacteria bacterium]|nr:N-formylglutamate amidohydrolase [Gammaproteobacteria bacterium]
MAGKGGTGTSVTGSLRPDESVTPAWRFSAEDAVPVEVFNTTGRARVILLCDHGSNAIPKELHALGLSEQLRHRHIAWDIGTFQVARYLSARFDAPLIRCGFSRLLIDPNRSPEHQQSIPAQSDGFTIPGNVGLDTEEIERRRVRFFQPYHRAIDKRIRHMRARGLVPALISIHSFTPALSCNTPRPWHIGVLWNRDGRIARPLIERLAGRSSVCVGDNKPYHANEPQGYTLPTHAERMGYPHVLIELRKDLIREHDGAHHWAVLLGDALAPILEDTAIYTIQYT